MRAPLTSCVLAVSVFAASLLATSAACQRTPEPGPTADAEALVEQGRTLWSTRTPANLIASQELFDSAIALDPTAPDAWAGLADASALLGLYAVLPPQDTMPRALSAARKALDLGGDQSGTWASLGLGQYLFEWDFVAAEQSFNRALVIDPTNYNARHWFAMMLSVLGRHVEAIDHIQQAAQSAPDSRLLRTKVGTILAAAGDLDRAESLLQAASDAFPDYALAKRELGYLHLRRNQYNQASRSFLAALDPAAASPASAATSTASAVGSAPDSGLLAKGNTKTLGALAHTLARAGSTEAALEIIQALEARRTSEYVPSLVFAHAWAGVNRIETATAELERAILERDPGLVYLYTKAGFEILPSTQLDGLTRQVGPLAPFRLAPTGLTPSGLDPSGLDPANPATSNLSPLTSEPGATEPGAQPGSTPAPNA